MTETCVLCPERERIPRRPPVDDGCRSWASSTIGDLRILTERLGHTDLANDRRLVVANLATRPTPQPGWLARKLGRPKPRIGQPRDPITAAMPSGSGGAHDGGAPVTGSKHPPIPINITRVDLTLPSRPGALSQIGRELARDHGDQIGQIPLASVLDTWVRAWARPRRESLPPARIAPMTRWLQARVDWACDVNADIVDFMAEITPYRATMRGLLGLIDLPERKVGVSCPGCLNRSLYREYGRLYIECAECPRVLSPAEFLRRAQDNVVCLHCVRIFEEALSPVADAA